MRIYLDSCIYIDHFDGRTDRLRPLGEFAFEVLRRTLSCEFQIIFSGLVLKELKYNSYGGQIKNLIKDLKEKNKIIVVENSNEDVAKARNIVRNKNYHFNDVLHAVTANRIRADYLVTRNVKDFWDLQNLVKICYPEHL